VALRIGGNRIYNHMQSCVGLRLQLPKTRRDCEQRFSENILQAGPDRLAANSQTARRRCNEDGLPPMPAIKSSL